MFLYNDSSDMDYYLYRQRIYLMPNSRNKRLLNDFNHSCKFSTYLDKGDILAKFGHRYLTFNHYAKPKDEIEFEGMPLKNLGGPFIEQED